MLCVQFDVILIDPPWEEYRRRAPGATMQNMAVWNERELLNLRIDLVANSPSFVFLWVGSAEGLRVGRDMIRQWGFRRCEDIAWVKTNRKSVWHSLRVLHMSGN